MDLEDALAAAQAQNAQQQRLIAFLQNNLETVQTTQAGLLDQLRILTELLKQTQATLEQERETSAARIAQLEAMLRSQTGKMDALLVHLGEKAPPKKPKTSTAKKARPKSSKPRRRDSHGRSGPPAHLERVEEEIAVEGCCPHCSHDRLHKHSELVSEAYDVVRAHVRVRRTTREVRRCGKCRKRVTAPAPPMPFDKVACTFEMMAYIAYQKLVLFVPIDRLGRDFEAQGAPLAPAMLHRWYVRCGDLVLPVVAQMRQELLAGDHLRFDGTGLKLLDFDTEGRPVINGQVIVFCTEQLVLFHPAESKHGAHIEDFLTVDVDGESRPWQGTATADAVNIHDQIFKVDGRTEAGCNAHGLRKFRDNADSGPLLAQEAMGFIGGWYKAEKEAAKAGLSGPALLAHRQQHAEPIATVFRTWLTEHLGKLSPQNPVEKALRYYDKHWKPLTAFLHDPAVPLDNNLSERLLRNVALLRKNALFSGTGEHVERLCGLLSVLQTCRLLGVDPYEYLVWMLPRTVTRGYKVDQLTPTAFKQRLADPEGFG